MSIDNPYAAPKAEVHDIVGAGPASDIASLQVSGAWKAKFYLIERAGGIKRPKLRELKFGERMKVNFNMLAFLFGPLYYAAKGMWKKGVVLLLLSVIVVAVVGSLCVVLGYGSLANAIGYGVGAIYATRANIDYYKKVVLGENGWL